MAIGAILGALGKMAGIGMEAGIEAGATATAVAVPVAVAAETAAIAGSAAAAGVEAGAIAGGVGSVAFEAAGAANIAIAESVLSLVPPVAETGAIAGEVASVSNLPLIESFMALPETVAPATESTSVVGKAAESLIPTSPLPPAEIPGLFETGRPIVPPSPEPTTPTISALPEPEVSPKAPEPESIKVENPSEQTIDLPKTEYKVGEGVEMGPDKNAPKSEPITQPLTEPTVDQKATEKASNSEDKNEIEIAKNADKETLEQKLKVSEEKKKKLEELEEEDLKELEKRRKQRELDSLELQLTMVEVQIGHINTLEEKPMDLQMKLDRLETRKVELNGKILALKAQMGMAALQG